MADDAILLSRAGAGDSEALRTLLESHGRQVWAAIDRDIGPAWQALIDADDVMQVTYMEAFLHAGDIRANNTAGFLNWLHNVAANNLRDAIKELGRKKRPSPAMRVGGGAKDQSYATLVELLGADSSTPSRHVAREEAAAAINAALARMPADYAEVVRLYDLEEQDIAAVGSRLGRSKGAVYMLRARAHDLLRSLLGQEADFFSRTA